MKVMKLFLFFIFLVTAFQTSLIANDQIDEQDKLAKKQEEEFHRKLKESMQADQQAMQQFFQSNDYKILEGRLKELMQRFGAWDDLNIDDFLNQNFMDNTLQNPLGGSGVDTYWDETNSEKKFVVKSGKDKTTPFNIVVEEGMIKINGSTLNEVKNDQGKVISRSYSSVNLSQDIPDDVDPDSVRYDQDKEGNIIVIFKKKIPSPKLKSNSKDKSFRPLGTDSDDTTI